MEDFKSKMIEDLKKSKVVTPIIVKEEIEKPKKKKNKKKVDIVPEEYKEVDKIKTDFENFKEDFFKKENIKSIISYIENYKEEDPDMFDSEILALCKYQHPGMKIVAIEPNEMQEELGVVTKFWIVKPLYRKEYTDFTKNYGHREEFPDEFVDFAIKKCLLHPILKDEEFNTLPSGTVITLHHTIMELSDLNKKFKIIEV